MSRNEEERLKHNAYQKKYYGKNKEKILAYSKTYHENNKEEMLAYGKTYRENNKEEILAYNSNKHDCPCGGCYTNRHKSKHLNTKIHTEYINRPSAS